MTAKTCILSWVYGTSNPTYVRYEEGQWDLWELGNVFKGTAKAIAVHNYPGIRSSLSIGRTMERLDISDFYMPSIRVVEASCVNRCYFLGNTDDLRAEMREKYPDSFKDRGKIKDEVFYSLATAIAVATAPARVRNAWKPKKSDKD